jgi:cardiolipin synthase
LAEDSHLSAGYARALPNALTALRLALVPFVIQAILRGRHTLAVTLFAIASFTDILDGAAARRLRVASQSGAYLDPIADKCLLSGVFLALALAHLVPWWFVAIVFGRDLLIVLGVAAFLLFTSIRHFPPSIWGKISTFVQILTVVALLSRNVLEVRVLDAVSSAMLWLCSAFTIWSGLHYTARSIRIARAD